MEDTNQQNITPDSPVQTSEKENKVEAKSENVSTDSEIKNKKSFFSKKCKECEKLSSECAEYKTGWQRALADYKNLQRETENRRSEWAKMSEAQILEEFLPVYEHLKLAVNNSNQESVNSKQENFKTSDPWLDGVKFVLKQFGDILKQHGVEEIKTVGEKFDPRVHEAISEESVGGIEAGIITREISGGYKMGDRVVKVARVVVSK